MAARVGKKYIFLHGAKGSVSGIGNPFFLNEWVWNKSLEVTY